MIGILQQTKGLSLHFKDHNCEFKRKKTLKNLELFSNFKRKINLISKFHQNEIFYHVSYSSTTKKEYFKSQNTKHINKVRYSK